MKATCAALGFITCLGVATSARSEDPFSLRVTWQVRDYETGRIVTVEGISVTTEGPAYSAAPSGSGYALEATVAAGAPESLAVNVEVAEPHLSRRVSLRRLPSEQTSIQRSLELFLVKDESAPLSKIVGAAQLLNVGKTDRALALLEREYERMRDEYAHRHKLAIRYNYARALLDACLHLGYDTCELAKVQCHGLSEDLEAHPDQVQYLATVERNALETCEDHAKATMAWEAKERIRLAMESATRKISQGGRTSLEGARELEALLSDLREGRISALPRSTAALERDVAIGYMRYERYVSQEGAPAEEREGHLNQAIAHFESAIAGGDQSSVTARDLMHARGRLEALQQEIASNVAPIG